MSATAAAAPVRVLPLLPEVSAAANLTSEQVLMLGALGFEILLVRFQASHDSPIWDFPGFESELERELQAIDAGALGTSLPTSGAQWHFFHVSDLAKALAAFHARLAALGLLEITTLIHAFTAQEMRVCWPVPAQPVNPKATA